MKKIVCILLILCTVFLAFPFGVIAEGEEEISVKDMFAYDFELTDEEVVKCLEECRYSPYSNTRPYYGVVWVYCRVQYGGFETYEEIRDYFYETTGINRECFEKYLVTDPSLADCVYDEQDGYYKFGYWIFMRQEFLDELETYGSYEKAYYYAKLWYLISGKKYFYIPTYQRPVYTDNEMDHAIPGPVETFKYGEILPFDSNFDGKLNARDTMILKMAVLGMDVDCNYYTKDLTGDGVTNAKDVLYLKKYIATGVDLRK